MKVWEIVICGKEMLDILQKSCMSMDDCRYIGLYEEYKKLIVEGAKTIEANEVKEGVSE